MELDVNTIVILAWIVVILHYQLELKHLYHCLGDSSASKKGDLTYRHDPLFPNEQNHQIASCKNNFL